MLTRAAQLWFIKKSFRRYATSRGRMAFKTKYSNCRHNFGRTRPVARFWGLGGKIHFYRGKILNFIIYLKQFFLSTTKFEGHKEWFGGNCPRMPPCLRAWAESSPESLRWGSSYLCKGVRLSENSLFNSQHEQHLQIVQINYKYFPANTHKRRVVSNWYFLNQLNKRNCVINHCHLIDGDYLEMS